MSCAAIISLVDTRHHSSWGDITLAEEANPGVIFDTLNAFQQTGALKAAIELKLFTALGDGPLEASAIAKACNADSRGVRILCDYLTVFAFLQKTGNSYTLTPNSAMFLDERSPAYMGTVARFIASDEVLDTFRDVAGAVCKGGTLLPDGGSTKEDFELWVEFAKSMAPMMQPAAEFLAELIAKETPDGPIRVLDLAAGHGLFGITVAKRLPGAEVVGQDWEAVVAVAQENAQRAGVGERYSTLPGDAMSIEFGGRFDCVLLTNFLHHFDADTCESLLNKVRTSLSPGGLTMTLDFVPNEDRVSPRTAATFALAMLTSTGGGDAYTFSDYERMFQAAGFQKSQLIEVPHSPQRVVISRMVEN